MVTDIPNSKFGYWTTSNFLLFSPWLVYKNQNKKSLRLEEPKKMGKIQTVVDYQELLIIVRNRQSNFKNREPVPKA